MSVSAVFLPKKKLRLGIRTLGKFSVERYSIMNVWSVLLREMKDI